MRKVQEPRGWAVNTAVAIIKPTLTLTVRERWTDGDKIPATGGCLVVLNHISHVDPFLSARFVYDHGRIPRYLAKAGLFKIAGAGQILASAGQIPVERLTATAVGAYDAAVQAVHDGQCVVVYPEGTITRDPDLWPMVGKSGAARIALATGCPVVPVGQWGAQDVLAPYGKRLNVFPRRTVDLKAGDPVDLSDLVARVEETGTATSKTVAEATARIMAAITGLVEDLRGETAPAERFNPRTAGVSEIGNPTKDRKDRP